MKFQSPGNTVGLRSIVSDLKLMLEYRELSVLNFAILVSMIGFGLVVPFLPIYAEDFGASDTEIGLMVGFFAITRMICSPIGGYIADRFGRKPSMVFAMFMYCVVMFLFGLARTIPELFLYRGLQGAASGLMWPVAMTYVGDVVREEDRGKAMALFSVMWATGLAIGPILGGGIATTLDIEAAFYATSILAFLSAILLVVRVKESHKPVQRRVKGMGMRSALQEFRLSAITRSPRTFSGVCLGSFTIFFGIAVLFSILPIFGKKDLDLTNFHIGILFAAMGIVQLVFMFPAGVIGDRIGKRSIILTGSAVAAVFIGAIAFTTSFITLLLVVAIYTFGRSISRPLFPAIIASLTTKENRGKGMGIYTFTQNLSFAIGSSVGGFTAELFSRGFPFLLSAGMGLIGIIIVYLFVSKV